MAADSRPERQQDAQTIQQLREALEAAKVDLAQVAGNAWDHGPGGRYAVAEAGIARIDAALAAAGEPSQDRETV